MNNISLTIRLPYELNSKLTKVSKGVGMTKTNLIRGAIHDFLPSDSIDLDFSLPYDDTRKSRMVLNINQLTYDILKDATDRYGESLNTIVTVVSHLALKRASSWLSSVSQ